MNVRRVAAVASLVALTGCATTPIPADLASLTQNPAEYKNKRILVTGKVLENNPPQGDEYRTWSFVLGGPETYRITASEEGYNPSTIDKAYRLVEQARREGGKLTVTGRLRVGPYREIRKGTEIELDSVSYAGAQIGTDRGPFVRHYYYPYYYHGPFFFHYGFHHHYYYH